MKQRVWRDHNYFVGEKGVLIHNNCIEDLLKIIKNVVPLPNTNIPKRLTVNAGDKDVFVSASGLKHIHEDLFNPGFNAEANIFEFKIPIEQAENIFSIKMFDLSTAVEDVLPNVIANNSWGVKVFSGKWEMIFNDATTGQAIKLFHAVPNQ